MLQDMLRQTRNALIYADLALFVLDSREGVTYNDIALYKWLTFHKLKLDTDKVYKEKVYSQMSEEERHKQILQNEMNYWKKDTAGIQAPIDKDREEAGAE